MSCVGRLEGRQGVSFHEDRPLATPEVDVEVHCRQRASVRDAYPKLDPGPPKLLLHFQVDSAHDDNMYGEHYADEAFSDSYWARGLISLRLPGLVYEGSPLGGYEIPCVVGEEIGHHVVG